MNPQDRRQRFEFAARPQLDAAFNLARWLMRNDHDAQDAVQDALLRAYRAFDGVRGDGFRPWFLAIVRNVCYSTLGHPSNALAALEDLAAEPEAAQEHSDPHLALSRQTDREMLRAALEHVPVEFREVVILHELEAMSYKEIAEVVGAPLGTVMSRLSRGRQRLQQELARSPYKDLRNAM